MATFSVVAQNGQLYGPANEAVLAGWIQQGRVNRDTVLHWHETNQRVQAWTVPALQPALGLSPEQVAALLHGAPAYAQHPSAPAPIGYITPQAFDGPSVPNLSPFPVVGAVLLSIFVGPFATIYYGLVHGNLPKRRPDDPSAGKAIGFMFIPFFNLYWICFFWVRLCTRIDDERARVGLPPTAPRSLIVAMLWCCLGLIIPILNILVFFAVGIMAIVAIAKLQESINELAERTMRR